MAIEKKFNDKIGKCSVTFIASKNIVGNAQNVFLVGDFNFWNCMKTPMRKSKDGSFKVTLELDEQNSYQYKYFLDGQTWVNDDAAEEYLDSPYYDSKNCVVFTHNK